MSTSPAEKLTGIHYDEARFKRGLRTCMDFVVSELEFPWAGCAWHSSTKNLCSTANLRPKKKKKSVTLLI